MSCEEDSGKNMDKLKRMQRVRGARNMPRSGYGFHEEKKSKKIEANIEEEDDLEIRYWDIPVEDEDDDYEDQDEWIAWEEYKASLGQNEDEDDGS